MERRELISWVYDFLTYETMFKLTSLIWSKGCKADKNVKNIVTIRLTVIMEHIILD